MSSFLDLGLQMENGGRPIPHAQSQALLMRAAGGQWLRVPWPSLAIRLLCLVGLTQEMTSLFRFLHGVQGDNDQMLAKVYTQCNTRLSRLSVILFSIVPLIQASASSECVARRICPQPAAYGRQPIPAS